MSLELNEMTFPAALIEKNTLLQWNDPFRNLFHLPESPVLDITTFLTDEEKERFRYFIDPQRKESRSSIFRFQPHDETPFLALCTHIPLTSSPTRALLLFHPLHLPPADVPPFMVTDPLAFKKALDAIIEPVYLIDVHTRQFIYANQAFLDLLECEPADVRTSPLIDFVAPESKAFILERGRKRLNGEPLPSRYEFKAMTKKGKIFDLEIAVSEIIIGDRKTIIGVAHDITERKHMMAKIEEHEKQLTFQATHDALTGLWNQAYISEVIKHELNRFHRYGHPAALMFIDLDNFKEINEVFGHTMGNRFLREVSRFIAHQLRDADIMGRFGGDEFIVMMPETGAEEAQQVGRRVLQSLQKAVFHIDEQHFKASASIGIAITDPDIRDVDAFIQSANMAMYWAKEKGGNRLVVFDTEANQLHFGRPISEWRDLILEAVKEQKFVGYFQLIHDARDLHPVAAEIFIRMHVNHDELVPAAHFLPLAQRFGYSFTIDRWIIHYLPRWAKWLDSSFGTEFISFNTSPLSLTQSDFVDVLRHSISVDDIKSYGIHMELTGLHRLTSTALHQLRELKNYGLNLVLDDFGAGLIDPLLLKSLPINFIKIDGRLVQRLNSDARDRSFVQTFHNLARALKIRTIAEWVESKESLHEVQNLGLDYIQGYLLHRPQPLPPYLKS